MTPDDLFIGLMSGTSLDGVDGVLVGGVGPADSRGVELLATTHQPFDATARAELLALNEPGPDELHRAALAANRLASRCADACAALLAQGRVDRSRVRAIGAHGQTVRHRPGEFDGVGYTVQLDPGARLAELSGIDVVSNFRVRDVAAGGQGAPLVPGFHRRLLASRPSSRWQVALNVGGMANLTAVGPGGEVLGFDCGPGNVLLDLWAARHLGQAFDAGGDWASRGRVDGPLLDQLLRTPFVRQTPPKSTGRDLFHSRWLDGELARAGAGRRSPADVQATLAQFTVEAFVTGLDHLPGGARAVEAVWVCGGGARNLDLMTRLQIALAPAQVDTTAALGMDPQWVEAAAFAWLAACHLAGLPASIPAVTGAHRSHVLGTRHHA